MNKKTVFGGVRQVRPLSEVLADERSWKGTYPELLESVLRDEQHSLDTRLACANAPMRNGAGDKPRERSVDVGHLTRREQKALLHLMAKALRHPPSPITTTRDLELKACLAWLAGEDEVGDEPAEPQHEQRDVLL